MRRFFYRQADLCVHTISYSRNIRSVHKIIILRTDCVKSNCSSPRKKRLHWAIDIKNAKYRCLLQKVQVMGDLFTLVFRVPVYLQHTSKKEPFPTLGTQRTIAQEVIIH